MILDNLIYISYHDEDEKISETVYIELQKKGYNPWYRKLIIGGQTEKLEREKALTKARLILVILSEKGLQKRGILNEEIKFASKLAERTNEEEIFIIPIKLDSCTLPESIADLKAIDLPSNLELIPETIKKTGIQPISDAVTTKFSLIDETGELTISNKLKQLSREANRLYLALKNGDLINVGTDTIFLAGIYSYILKQFDEAYLRFGKAIKNGYKKDKGIQSRIAGCLIKRGENQKALKILEEVLKNSPDYVLALYNKAIALKKLGQISDAKSTINHILSIRPDSELARNNLAVILHEEGDIKGAIETLSYLVKRGKDKGLTNYNLACHYSRNIQSDNPAECSKKLSLAFEHLFKSFEFGLENVVDSINDPDLNYLKKTNEFGVSFWDITQNMSDYYTNKAIDTANILLMSNKLDEALEKLSEITRLGIKNSDIYYAIARVQCKIGNFTESINYLKLAIKDNHQLKKNAAHDPIFNNLKTQNNGKLYWDFISQDEQNQ